MASSTSVEIRTNVGGGQRRVQAISPISVALQRTSRLNRAGAESVSFSSSREFQRVLRRLTAASQVPSPKTGICEEVGERRTRRHITVSQTVQHRIIPFQSRRENEDLHLLLRVKRVSELEAVRPVDADTSIMRPLCLPPRRDFGPPATSASMGTSHSRAGCSGGHDERREVGKRDGGGEGVIGRRVRVEGKRTMRKG